MNGRGFTLVEMLVVLTILAALIAIVAPVLFQTQTEGERAATAATIQKIKAALHQMQNDPRFGDLPPTSLAEAGFTPPNDLNEGIETLVVVLGAETSPMNPFDDEERLINTDGDRDPERTTLGRARDFFEYADAWGNPLIYFRLRDFAEDPRRRVRYRLVSGEEIEVGPVVSPKTKTFAGTHDGFQLISLGPDELFGTEDDVVSWSSR